MEWDGFLPRGPCWCHVVPHGSAAQGWHFKTGIPKALKPPHLFSFINGLSDDFLYGNIEPTDTYASNSAFSHEMKFQSLDGIIMVSTWGLLFLLEIRWKLQDTKSRDLLKVFIFCSFPEKKIWYQQCHSHCDDGNLNLAWGRALFDHFWVRAECACFTFNLIN